MPLDTKGKDKAKDGVVSGSDSDSSIDFFIMKPRAIRSLPKSVTVEEPVELSDDTDDDDDDEEGTTKKKKKKKRYKKPVHKPILPEWTKVSSTRSSDASRKRSSTEDRQSRERADVVVISSDETSPKRSKGKGKETEIRSRVVLTPPPQITEAERAKWREQARQALSPPKGAAVTIDDDEDDVPATLGPELPPDSEKIYVYVSMMTDRTKLPPDASERAIKHWETRRKICIFRDGKLDMLWYAIGESWNRNPDGIVLSHAGRRIYSKLRTARDLGIDDGADLTAYEKSHWERLEKEKLREIDRITQGDAAYLVPSDDESPAAIPAETVRKIKISLRGEWGTRKIAVPQTITGADLALTYCIKSNKSSDMAGKLRLVFDGETIEGDDMPLETMDLDDGDMIDVEVPKV